MMTFMSGLAPLQGRARRISSSRRVKDMLTSVFKSSARRSGGRALIQRGWTALVGDVNQGVVTTTMSFSGATRGMASVSRERTAVTAKLWHARLRAAKLAGVDQNPANMLAQEKLVSKPPHRTTVGYDFKDDEDVREAYRNPWNEVRLGRVLEDLDSLAGNIAFAHCDDADVATRPQLLVTASVDRVRLLRPLRLSEDMNLSGAVAWVGRSSIVIRMEAWPRDHPDAPEDPGLYDPFAEDRVKYDSYEPGPSLTADFTFVARDSVTNKGAAVNPLVPETDEQKALFERTAERVERKKARMRLERTSGGVDGALSPELAESKRLFVDEATRAARALRELPALAPATDVPMDATRTENMFVAQPQQRNLSGRIFGGFLLRRAFELAFATTYVFGGAKPKFHSVADMNFLRPVEVGDLMRVRARVLHSAQTSCGRPVVDVEVEALVTKPESMRSEVSNTFMFKFYVGERNEGRVARRVLPSSREEAAHVWEKCVRPGVQVKLEEQTP